MVVMIIHLEESGGRVPEGDERNGKMRQIHLDLDMIK